MLRPRRVVDCMNTSRVTTINLPGASTLEALPARVLTFLIAIATRAPIRALMYQGGFRAEDHAEGWRLLMATGQIRERSPVGAALFRANTAMTEIHEWVTTNFRRYRAALERLHPEWAWVFSEVDSRYPAESLLAMATLLEALRRGDGGHDLPLQTTLAQRGLHSAEIERLAHLVTDAQNVDNGPPGDEAELDDRTAELVTLYHWYRDWVESAKRFVTRKDFRVQLGIGGRRDT
jgi:hypothetical protein